MRATWDRPPILSGPNTMPTSVVRREHGACSARSLTERCAACETRRVRPCCVSHMGCAPSRQVTVDGTPYRQKGSNDTESEGNERYELYTRHRSDLRKNEMGRRNSKDAGLEASPSTLPALHHPSRRAGYGFASPLTSPTIPPLFPVGKPLPAAGETRRSGVHSQGFQKLCRTLPSRA